MAHSEISLDNVWGLRVDPLSYYYIGVAMSTSYFKPKRTKEYAKNYEYIFDKRPTLIKKILALFKRS